VFNYRTDFEGVTIVPSEWYSEDDMIAYLVHEGEVVVIVHIYSR